jgi:flagellar hook assembly protein FlgD
MSRNVHLLKIFLSFIFFLSLSIGLNARPSVSIEKTKAYPNPFKEHVTIEYQLQQSGRVEILINNILGQKIKSLIKEEQQAGLKRVKWDGIDESGSLVGSGMYYITLLTPTDKKVIKVMKTK